MAGLLERAVAAGSAPSAVAAWGQVGREPRVEFFGRAQLGQEGRGAVRETRYDLASLTKPLVTTTLSLLAVRNGVLDLDASVGEVVGFGVRPPLARATIAQLLSHSAGLPAWRPIYATGGEPSEIANLVLDIEPISEPGNQVVYSCLGFILLGTILERLFGDPLASGFQKQVTGPLGLDDELGFTPDAEDPRLAGGAGSPEPELQMCADLGFPEEVVPGVGMGQANDGNARWAGGIAGNSGLFGTARGVWALAAQYLLTSGGTLLHSEEIAAATRPVAADGQQFRGLGWQLSKTSGCSAGPALGQRAFGHNGFTGTSVWVDPDLDAVFVLLTNRHHPGYHDVDLHPLRRRFHELAVREL